MSRVRDVHVMSGDSLLETGFRGRCSGDSLMLIQMNLSCVASSLPGTFRDFMRKSDVFANLWFSAHGSFAIRTSGRTFKTVIDEHMAWSPGRGGVRLP